MRILVCVKQVPDTAEVRIDPVKNTLVREGVPGILNPYDGYALEAAARIRDRHPETTVTALTMGPAQAEAMLRDCLSVAADEAYLVSDPLFVGSDTLATSYILSRAVHALAARGGGFDLIFCGRQAVDGETAQVGPALAGQLGWAQAACCLEAVTDGRTVTVRRETDGGIEVLSADLPCVLTFTKPGWEPRYPTIQRRLAAKRAVIGVLRADDLPGLDRSRAGLAGSPTRVRRTFVPPQRTQGVVIREDNGAAAAGRLFALLRGGHVI